MSVIMIYLFAVLGLALVCSILTKMILSPYDDIALLFLSLTVVFGKWAFVIGGTHAIVYYVLTSS